MFDEPSSYLDVKQRLKAAITIRSLITPDRFVTSKLRFDPWRCTAALKRDVALQVHHRGGARSERAGLPVGLHLLSVRSAERLWSRYHALQRQRG